MVGNQFREMLRCIRCGACMNHCPVYLTAGGHAYGWVYAGARWARCSRRSSIGIEKGWPLPNASTFCGRCEEVCPVRIPLPKLMRFLARGAVQPRPRPARPPATGWRPGASSPAARASTASPPAPPCKGLAPPRPPRPLPPPAARRRLDARRATCPHPRGRTFMAQWAKARGKRAAVSAAREAILARLRHAYARDEQAQAAAVAEAWDRLGRHEANLVPERGQRDAEGRVALFTEMAQAVMADVQRRAVPAGRARPPSPPICAGTTSRSASSWRPIRCLDRCGWESQPLLRVRRGTAAGSDLVGVTVAERGRRRDRHAAARLLARAADAPGLPARDQHRPPPGGADRGRLRAGLGACARPAGRPAALGQLGHRAVAQRRHRGQARARRPRAAPAPGPRPRPRRRLSRRRCRAARGA